jgi:hypothetical protein
MIRFRESYYFTLVARAGTGHVFINLKQLVIRGSA